jgi:predicted hydrocarbon binding protein
MNRRYAFSWELLGDLELGRPNLGPLTRVEVYRLMQFSMRDVLERELGTEAADRIFFEAGHLAGQALYDHLIKPVGSFEELVAKLQRTLRELSIGVLRLEEAEPQGTRLALTISEDLDCSGLPELSYEVCRYDEGFIAAVLERFTGKKYDVKEIDCWCTGDRTCRFRAELAPA